VRRFRLEHHVRTRLWLLPLLCVLTGLGLALTVLAIDKAAGHDLVGQSVTGSAASVQTILTAAATALVTLTSVVLSLTLVAVQLAMGQFSPRIVRAILHDRRSQFAVGMFIGTWAYTMTVLREVNASKTGGGGGSVPGLAIAVDYALILGAVITLVLYVHHTAQSIRAGGLIGLVGDETRQQIDALFPVPDVVEEDPSVILATRPGVVTKLHRRALVAIAAEAGCRLELVPAMGDFVPLGAPLFRVEGSLPDEARPIVEQCVLLGRERTHEDDPAYGIRKLVDIAERSIYSSPFQDPSTSVQALNPIHDCLRRIVQRPFPSGRHSDSDGNVRLVERVLDWEGYVRLAFDEIRMVGAGSPPVARRMRAALIDLKGVAPPERVAPLDRQLELLDAAVRREFADEADARAALVPDLQGIGSGPDVMAAHNGAASRRRNGGSGAASPPADSRAARTN
jgi:uncharacterized membrane protein